MFREKEAVIIKSCHKNKIFGLDIWNCLYLTEDPNADNNKGDDDETKRVTNRDGLMLRQTGHAIFQM